MSSGATPTNNAAFTLAEIAVACHGELINNAGGITVCGVSTDSRNLPPGALFIALRGEKFDGHDYVAQIPTTGAAVVERSWLVANSDISLPLIAVDDALIALGKIAALHRQRFSLPVVGVTGSYGKTTTRSLIATALGAEFRTLSSAGNFNNEIGVPQTLLQLDETHQAAVIEMGMRGTGQIQYLAEITGPTVGVITNIGPQHIELLGTVEKIAAAKAELLQSLPPDGLAVLPADDEFLPLLHDFSPCRIATFGNAAESDYRASDVTVDEIGNISFLVTRRATGESQRVSLPLPGQHNARNAAAAIAVAVELGIPMADAANALSRAEVPGGRMRVIRTPRWTIIDDCYNAGPNSMRAALETLRDFPGAGRRVAVLGSMRELGDHAPEEHRNIGAFAATVADLVVGVGQETKDLIGAAQSVRTQWYPDSATASEQAASWLQAGDVVLVKGSRSIGLEKVVSSIKE